MLVLGAYTRFAVACPKAAKNHGIRIPTCTRLAIFDRWQGDRKIVSVLLQTQRSNLSARVARPGNEQFRTQQQIFRALAMNRRTHLRSLVALGMRLRLGCQSCFRAHRPKQEADTQALEHVLAKLFVDRDGARAVGYSYLALFPETARGALASRTLLAPRPGASALAVALTRRRQEEFARSETVTIGGWVLARCEADMCAALALLSCE